MPVSAFFSMPQEVAESPGLGAEVFITVVDPQGQPVDFGKLWFQKMLKLSMNQLKQLKKL